MADREDPVTPGMERPGMEGEETPQLIAAGKVHGTPVYNRDGEHLGTIEDVMLDKRSGRVAYAVMSFGGFLGLGEEFYTLPWATLRYDPEQDAYMVDVTEEQLRAAPPRTPEGTDPAEDAEWEEQIHRYYNAAPYWGI
jgi:hypothetical protein